MFHINILVQLKTGVQTFVQLRQLFAEGQDLGIFNSSFSVHSIFLGFQCSLNDTNQKNDILDCCQQSPYRPFGISALYAFSLDFRKTLEENHCAC